MTFSPGARPGRRRRRRRPDTFDDRGEKTRARQAARRFTEARVSAVLGPGTAPAARAAGQAGSALTNRLSRTPPHQGTTSVHPVAADSDDFAPAVRAALAAKAQAVVFSGISPERAARCARALADAGFTGPRLGTWHTMGPGFLQQAGAAGQDWLFGTPFTDPGSASRTFGTAYRARYGTAPGRWSPEAYDAVGLVARTLEQLGGTPDIEPGAVAQRLFHVTYRGLAKTLRFTTNSTRTVGQDAWYFLFQATGNTFRFLARNDQVT